MITTEQAKCSSNISIPSLLGGLKPMCKGCLQGGLQFRALWMSMIPHPKSQKQNQNEPKNRPIQKLMSGSHGRFEYGLLPAITATAAQWADGRLWSSLAASNDFHRCVGWTSPWKSRSLHHQQWSGSLGCSGFKICTAFLHLFTKSQRTTHIHSLNQHMSHMFARFCSLHVFFIFLPSYLALFNQSDFKFCLVCHMLSPALCSLTRDYVYFQKTPLSVGQSIVQSQIWPRAAGSDHRAVSGDVVLNRWSLLPQKSGATHVRIILDHKHGNLQ